MKERQIYVVMCTTGHYEDRDTFVERAYANERDAKAYAKMLNDEFDKKQKKYDAIMDRFRYAFNFNGETVNDGLDINEACEKAYLAYIKENDPAYYKKYLDGEKEYDEKQPEHVKNNSVLTILKLDFDWDEYYDRMGDWNDEIQDYVKKEYFIKAGFSEKDAEDIIYVRKYEDENNLKEDPYFYVASQPITFIDND